MRIIETANELKAAVHALKKEQQRIALVPTMGNLHEGHLALVKTAQQKATCVIVTLFVNPTQFGANEDLDNYPRTFQDDVEKLTALKADILFAPTIDEMYPNGGQATSCVHVPELTNVLCGASRPGHFDGVTTIVAKLFHLSQADVAVFGEKDFQQLAVIRRMVEDLNFPIDIIGEPIVREKNGLAMSSRNGYLSPNERERATALYQTLLTIKQCILQGDNDYLSLCQKYTQQLNEQGFHTDYLTVCDQNSLQAATETHTKLVILVAAKLNNTRLIDNLTLELDA